MVQTKDMQKLLLMTQNLTSFTSVLSTKSKQILTKGYYSSRNSSSELKSENQDKTR